MNTREYDLANLAYSLHTTVESRRDLLPAALWDATAAENILSPNGRGVLLMRRLVDDVKFNLGGRQVVLRKRFRAT